MRGVSPTTKPIRPTAVRPSSGAHTHMRAIATVCRLHSTVSTSQGQPRAASPPADDVCRLNAEAPCSTAGPVLPQSFFFFFFFPSLLIGACFQENPHF